MGHVKIIFDITDADGNTGVEMRTVNTVIVDIENETVSVLYGDNYEVYVGTRNVHNIIAKGVEITYA